MINLTKRLNKLEIDIMSEYKRLLREKEKYDFLLEVINNLDFKLNGNTMAEIIEELENTDIDHFILELLPVISFKNSFSGDVFNITVLSVSKKGIYAAMLDNSYESSLFNFGGLASIEDQITLIERMKIF